MPKRRRSIPSLFERQLVNWSTSSFRSSTIDQYQSVIRRFEQSLKPRSLHGAARADVVRYVSSCAEQARGRALAALHGFLEYLVERRKLDYDVSAGVTVAETNRVPTREDTSCLLLSDGVSRSEVQNMAWGDAVVQLLSPPRPRQLSNATRDALLTLLRERFPGRDILRDLGDASGELIF